MTEDGYIPVDSATLATRYPGVYAIGDVATAGVPKAGVFAEGAARVVAQAIVARRSGGEPPNAIWDGAPATSSSARGVSAASTSTSCPVRPKRARSTRLRRSRWQRRSGSVEPPRSLVRGVNVVP